MVTFRNSLGRLERWYDQNDDQATGTCMKDGSEVTETEKGEELSAVYADLI